MTGETFFVFLLLLTLSMLMIGLGFNQITSAQPVPLIARHP